MDRRRFVEGVFGAALAGMTSGPRAEAPQQGSAAEAMTRALPHEVKLFVCGDVMTGRGIDQILPHPGDPCLHEPYVRSAQRYVALAEKATGPLPRPVDFAYVWGDALASGEHERPDLRIVNLETAVTTSDDAWPGKEIHYRMHPANARCLTAAGIDCCTLANNHVLDWGYRGLEDTVASLHGVGIRTAGAGRDIAAAAAPAILDARAGSRVLVYAFATTNAGVPRRWAATHERAGVQLLHDLDRAAVTDIGRRVAEEKRTGDLALASIHWGANWGYAVPPSQRRFAHALIDDAGIDVIVGHSSHHPLGIEVYRDRLILHGCGDLLNDYEGIGGHEAFRADLTAAYYATLDAATGRLERLTLAPLRIRHFRLNRASAEEARWLAQTLSREGRGLATRVLREDDALVVQWDRT